MHFIEFRRHVSELIKDGALGSFNDVLRYAVENNQRREVTMRMAMEQSRQASLEAIFPCYGSEKPLLPHEIEYVTHHADKDTLFSILRQMLATPEPFLTKSSKQEKAIFQKMMDILTQPSTGPARYADNKDFFVLADLILASTEDHEWASQVMEKAIDVLLIVPDHRKMNDHLSSIMADIDAMKETNVRDCALFMDHILYPTIRSKVSPLARVYQYDNILFFENKPKVMPVEIYDRVKVRLQDSINHLNQKLSKAPEQVLIVIKGQKNNFYSKRDYEEEMLMLSTKLKYLPLPSSTVNDMIQKMVFALLGNDTFTPSRQTIQKLIEPIKDKIDWPTFLEKLDDDMTSLFIESFTERKYYLKHLDGKHIHKAMEASFGL